MAKDKSEKKAKSSSSTAKSLKSTPQKVPTSKEILLKAEAAKGKVDKKTSVDSSKSKKVAAKVTGKKKEAEKKSKAKASESSDSSDDEDEKKPATNGKANGKDVSSDESSESESEDEKPKAQQVKTSPAKKPTTSSNSSEDSDSSESEDEKKAASSDSSDSSSEEEDSKPTKKATPAKAIPAKKADSSSDSSDSSSDEDAKPTTKATPAKSTPAKPVSAKKASDSSSDSSDSSDDEDPKPTTKSTQAKKAQKSSSESSDSSDSSDDEESSKPAIAKKPATSSSSSSSSDSDSDSDVEMADATKSAAKPVANGKRKAPDTEESAPKKQKLANGEAATTGNDVQETKSIFVGQLSWNVDNDRLAEEFASCGEVVSATVQMDRNSGRSKGFGYVHFTTTEAVEKALEMNGQEIDGRAIKVDRSTPPNRDAAREKRAKAFGDSQSPPSNTLFVGNLSFGVSEDTVWEFFNEWGVKNVRLPTDRDTGRPKGFGYVEFENIDGAKAAFDAKQGGELEGRSVRLDFSQPRDSSGGGRGGFGGRGGDRGGFGGRGGRGGGDRGGFGGRGGGDRGGRGRGGGRGGGRGRGAPRGGSARTGGIVPHENVKKITFD